MQRKTFADEKEGWNASTWAEIDIRSTLDKYINSQTLNNVRGLNAYVRCYEILTKTLTDINAQTYTVTQIAQIMQELGIWNNAVFTEMFSTNSALSQFKLCQLNTANQENITSSIKQNLRGEQRDLAMYFYRIMQQTNRRANYFSIDQQLRKERTKLLEFFTKNKNSPLYLEILAKQNSAVQEKFIDYLLNALEIKDLCLPDSAENAPPIYNPQIFSKTTFTDHDLENLFGKETYAELKHIEALSYLFENISTADDRLTPNIFADTHNIFNANNYRTHYLGQRDIQRLQGHLEKARKTFNDLLRQKQAEDRAETILRELLDRAHELKQEKLAEQSQGIGG